MYVNIPKKFPKLTTARNSTEKFKCIRNQRKPPTKKIFFYREILKCLLIKVCFVLKDVSNQGLHCVYSPSKKKKKVPEIVDKHTTII